MEAHAELAEAEFAESGFATFHQREALGSHFGAVGKARSEARGGWAIPGRQSGVLRQKPNLRFAQAGVEQRRENLVYRRRTMAGAEIERVIGVHAVGHSGNALQPRQFVQRGEKFILTEVTAI